MTMPAWSEAMLRAAASWQAFKEGGRLASAATVSSSAADGYRGSVRTGARTHQTRVTVHSPTHLEVRCSCPENQATGAVCAHAVALGLAALRPSVAGVANPVAATAPTAVAGDEPTAAWTIEFPPNWPEALAQGRLAPVLRHASGPAADSTPQDRQLASWLRSVGGSAEKSPQHLHVTGDRLLEFLALLADHPRVTTRSGPLRMADDARLPLRSLTLHGDTVHLAPDEDFATIRCGASVWHHRPGQLVRLHPAAGTLSRQLPLASFLDQLDAFQQAFIIPDDCFVNRLHFVPAPLTVLLHLDGHPQSLRATLAVRYDRDHPPLAPGQAGATGLPRLDQDDRCLVRDRDGENAAAEMLVRAGFQPPPIPTEAWRLTDPDAIIRFLTRTLPSLQRNWTVTESAQLAKARANLTLVRPKISILGSGEDWLDFNLSFESEAGEIFSHADIHRLLRSGKSGSAFKTIISSEATDLLEPLFEELDLRQQDGRFTASRLAAAVIDEIRKNLDKTLISSRQQFEDWPAVPATVQAVLRPYQHQGLAWLSDQLKRYSGALLADDMGLGKTLQTIVLIELMASRTSGQPPLVLVVAPTSLLGNWAAEFARFAPGRVVHRLHGAGRDAVRERVGPGSVVLTSFATLPRDLAWHLRQDYALAVVDEASQMRNPDTDHAKALCKLNARHRLALSGTPVENAVRDLWSIFRFLLPGWLGDRASFRERYELPLATIPPDPAVLARLRMKTAPFVLRRTKAQVAPELPGKLVIDEFCDLSAPQRAAYQQLLTEGRKRVEALEANSGAARMHLLTTLLRLRQTCCDLALMGGERARELDLARRSAKLERLLELLETALSEGSKVLVFSQFRTQLLEIETQVAARGWRSLRLDGQTANRQEVVSRFQTADGPPVFLISLKAGGYGLNLTAADTVIHFDPWWNPAVEAQATDRAHRIGQTKPVTVYRLLARDTVEEKVLRLQARKRDFAAIIDETGEADFPALAEADLRALLE